MNSTAIYSSRKHFEIVVDIPRFEGADMSYRHQEYRTTLTLRNLDMYHHRGKKISDYELTGI